MRRMLSWIAAALVAAPAFAHDTWFVREGGALSLATGNRFPVAEVTVPASQALAHSCGALACRAEIAEHSVELDPAKVDVYLREIQADAAVRATWARWQADGLPWRERYRKYARIEWDPPGATAAQRLRARAPTGLGLELVVLGGERIAPMKATSFQLLRDGAPLRDFPLELVSDRGRLGVWRRTDANGVVHHVLPFAGQWLLRGTHLEPSATEPGTWRSRFVTLAFEVR